MILMLAEPPGPHGSPTWNRYSAGLARFAVELAALVQQAAVAEVGGDPADLAERLELLRAHLHQEVDKAIDAEAVRHPSPRRLIFRARHYFRESA
ncbi:hypothetical protein [Actinomadura opuntiae]|uniref:hypothetical protein n=1 Tax=Actinomadura sp. OS1-43 TaxID=604315 RepID=UPI00255ABCE3|nr:hypothetical protein [Actinomadura sp. OS1-43]MDL4815487.1 hypothetical protein [Actinomadura sp. OS1-43]